MPILFCPHRGRFEAQFGLIAEGGTVKPGPWSHLAHHCPSQSHLKIPAPTTHRRLAGILENIPHHSFLLRIHAELFRKIIFPKRLQLARTPTRKCVRERSQPHVGLGPEIGLEIQRSEERLFSQIAPNSSGADVSRAAEFDHQFRLKFSLPREGYFRRSLVIRPRTYWKTCKVQKSAARPN